MWVVGGWFFSLGCSNQPVCADGFIFANSGADFRPRRGERGNAFQFYGRTRRKTKRDFYGEDEGRGKESNQKEERLKEENRTL